MCPCPGQASSAILLSALQALLNKHKNAVSQPGQDEIQLYATARDAVATDCCCSRLLHACVRCATVGRAPDDELGPSDELRPSNHIEGPACISLCHRHAATRSSLTDWWQRDARAPPARQNQARQGAGAPSQQQAEQRPLQIKLLPLPVLASSRGREVTTGRNIKRTSDKSVVQVGCSAGVGLCDRMHAERSRGGAPPFPLIINVQSERCSQRVFVWFENANGSAGRAKGGLVE
jgi:hypothetical protein